MSEVVIERNSYSFFDPDNTFSDSKKCYLLTSVKVKDGTIFNKKVKTTERYVKKY